MCIRISMYTWNACIACKLHMHSIYIHMNIVWYLEQSIVWYLEHSSYFLFRLKSRDASLDSSEQPLRQKRLKHVPIPQNLLHFTAETKRYRQRRCAGACFAKHWWGTEMRVTGILLSLARRKIYSKPIPRAPSIYTYIYICLSFLLWGRKHDEYDLL